MINKVSVIQDAEGAWWLEYFTDDIRHMIMLSDVASLQSQWTAALVANAEVAELNADLRARLEQQAQELARLRAEREQLYKTAVLALRALMSFSAELPGELPVLDHYVANEIDDDLWKRLYKDAVAEE